MRNPQEKVVAALGLVVLGMPIPAVARVISAKYDTIKAWVEMLKRNRDGVKDLVAQKLRRASIGRLKGREWEREWATPLHDFFYWIEEAGLSTWCENPESPWQQNITDAKWLNSRAQKLAMPWTGPFRILRGGKVEVPDG